MKNTMKNLFLLIAIAVLCFTVVIGANASDENTEPHKHEYESIATDYDCESFGRVEYRCNLCGDSYTESIPASGHQDNDYDGACDYCGGIFAGDYLYKFAKITETGYYDYSDEPTDAVMIFNYIGNSTSVVTPTELDGYKVIGIGGGAFAGSSIEEVTISSSIEVVGSLAFECCIYLEKVVFESCKEIYGGAFGSCLSLKEVELPENLQIIYPAAFMGCFS